MKINKKILGGLAFTVLILGVLLYNRYLAAKDFHHEAMFVINEQQHLLESVYATAQNQDLEKITLTMQKSAEFIREIQNHLYATNNLFIFLSLLFAVSSIGIGILIVRYESKQEEITIANAKGQFLANMGHEIRTPMTSVLGLTDLLLEEDLTKKQHVMVKTIHQLGDSLLSILDDVLNFSKTDAKQVSVKQEPFDLHQLGKSLHDLMQARAEEKGLSLICDFDNTPLHLLGDKFRIQQVLSNFLSNAIKFTQQGEVKISIKTINNDGTNVTFIAGVKDTGTGVPKDMIETMFEVSIQKTGYHTYDSMSMGLNISKKLVEMMGGEIALESELDSGSFFYFTLSLPISNDQPVLEQTKKVDAVQKCHILVVDDNKTNLMVAEGILAKQPNYVVDSALNGAEACEKVAQNKYDLVLMDMQMPIVDGLEATRIIRDEESGGRIPIIAMTANALQEHQDACIEAGMDDYLSKPVRPDTLIAMIEKWRNKTS